MLNETQLDIIKELVNIGVGRAAAMLNEMLATEIKLSAPDAVFAECNDVPQLFDGQTGESITSVEFEFKGNITGTLKLLISKEKASELVSRLTGEEKGTYELDSVTVGTLIEVGNIILNSIIGSFRSLVSTQFDFSLPTFRENSIDNLVCNKDSIQKIHIIFNSIKFGIEDSIIDSAVLFMIDDTSLNQLKNILNRF